MSTHQQLVELGAKWLRSKANPYCMPIVYTELVTGANEVPDIFGMGSGHSALIEVKTSRADFLRDRKKFTRRLSEEGIGNYRWYLCPQDLITTDDLPFRWGLLEARGKKIGIQIAAVSQIASMKSERAFLYSCLRRELGK